MKKRILSLFLAGALCLTMFAGCTGEEEHVCDFGKWKVDEEATCEEDGVEVRKCDCGEKEERPIAKLEHKYTEKITTEATCAAEGVKTFTCENCDDSYTEAIAKLEHTYTSQVTTETSCGAEGVTTFTCSGCNHSYTEAINKTAHNYVGQVTTEVSCETDGVKTFTCSGCNDSYTEAIPAVTYSSTELPVMFEDSVGEVTVYDTNGEAFALGTCFVISADGKLITNYHVIEGGYSATVTLDGKTYTVEKVLAYDKTIDVAVLKVNASNLKAVTICYKTHRTGETVYTLGSSLGLTATFADGMITTAEREVDGVLYVQHDAPISSGNSGGPLINIYGEVIGINTWTYLDSQQLNFAIHTSELNNLDYSNPMTMAEVYEAENAGAESYDALLNFIYTNGVLDYESDNTPYYSVVLDKWDYNGYSYYSMMYYYPDTDELSLDLLIEQGDLYYWVYISLNPQLDGDYYWDYFDSDTSYMWGYLDAPSFTANSTLSYYETDVPSDYVEDVVMLSTQMVHTSLAYFAEVVTYYTDVTLADIGFTNYN